MADETAPQPQPEPKPNGKPNGKPNNGKPTNSKPNKGGRPKRQPGDTWKRRTQEEKEKLVLTVMEWIGQQGLPESKVRYVLRQPPYSLSKSQRAVYLKVARARLIRELGSPETLRCEQWNLLKQIARGGKDEPARVAAIREMNALMGLRKPEQLDVRMTGEQTLRLSLGALRDDQIDALLELEAKAKAGGGQKKLTIDAEFTKPNGNGKSE